MSKTKAIALSTTPLAIVALTVTPAITVAEDEAVANYPTVGLQYKKALGDDMVNLSAGKPVFFPCPGPTRPFHVGDIVGYVATQSGSTSGYQDES